MRKVSQYNGIKLVATYDSLSDAEAKTGISAGSISKCICGKLSKAGGYTWKGVTEKKLKASKLLWTVKKNGTIIHEGYLGDTSKFLGMDKDKLVNAYYGYGSLPEGITVACSKKPLAGYADGKRLGNGWTETFVGEHYFWDVCLTVLGYCTINEFTELEKQIHKLHKSLCKQYGLSGITTEDVPTTMYTATRSNNKKFITFQLCANKGLEKEEIINKYRQVIDDLSRWLEAEWGLKRAR